RLRLWQAVARNARSRRPGRCGTRMHFRRYGVMEKRETPADFAAQPLWSMARGISPLVGTAIHDGHLVHDGLASRMALSAKERLREEDPFTARFIQDMSNRIVVHRSRFE